MPAPKFLKCDCVHCGGHIEFPADGIGNVLPCPHCGMDTELILPEPNVDSPGFSRSVKWAGVGVIILVVGVAGVFVALSMARRMARRPDAPASLSSRAPGGPAQVVPAKWVEHTNHFSSSKVTVDAQADRNVRYATGTLRNELDTQRFGVTVELELVDAAGARVGTAQDYRAVMEPGAEWNYRALVVTGQPAEARVILIREQR
jgi:hypothetical protein